MLAALQYLQIEIIIQFVKYHLLVLLLLPYFSFSVFSYVSVSYFSMSFSSYFSFSLSSKLVTK